MQTTQKVVTTPLSETSTNSSHGAKLAGEFTIGGMKTLPVFESFEPRIFLSLKARSWRAR
jgi:hypothetical protein